MSSDLYISKEEPSPCSYDENYKVVIHRFDMGDCRCRCGEKVVRKPKKQVRMKFGRELKD